MHVNELRPRLSIVIINWNTKGMLRECLRSIRASGYTNLETIVWDNHSSDGSCEVVRNDFSEVKLIASNENLGFGAGNNAALAHARGDYILLLNPDTELRGDILNQVTDFLQQRQDVGVVGVRQVEKDGVLQASCGNLPSLRVMFLQQCMTALSIIGAHRLLTRLSRWSGVMIPPSGRLAIFFDFNGISEVGWVMGAFMMMPRHVAERTKLFDESFVMYGEDIDLCARIHQLGFKVAYFGGAEILHHGGASVKKIPVKSDAMRFVAMAHYYQKHHASSALIYRLFLGGASLVLILSGLIFRNQDAKARGCARLRAAWSPSWGDFLLSSGN